MSDKKTYDDTNRGALFLNDRKEQDSHPDRKGSINIDGKEYWLSAWDRDTARGPVISISVQAKDGAKQTAQKAGNAKREAERHTRATGRNDFADDDIGF